MKNSKNESILFYHILLALIVHVFTILCMLDVYFTSPLENITKHYKSAIKTPPAKRVVFIMADGLRASLVYTNNMSRVMPNLYAIKEHGGSWGVAHTIAPTESRPAQIAIASGFFEDPSAIYKNWKDNKVPFDSFINQSRRTFHFGDPSFCKYVGKHKASHVKSVYPYALFVNKTHLNPEDPVYVERNVIYKTIKFIQEGGVSRSEDGIIISVYLVGLDIACHNWAPNSSVVANNLRIFDIGVGMLQFYTEHYFKDNKTAYVMTADHGMAMSGKRKDGHHGKGSKEETEVPIMVWGSGVARVNKLQDMRLIDIAPLVTSLLGLNFPTNSLGSVPARYLNVTDKELANVLVANAFQLGEIFVAKERNLKENGALLAFIQYSQLSENDFNDWKKLIESNIDKVKFSEISNSAMIIINNLIHGIQYYKNYSHWYRSIVVTFSLLNWLLYLSSWLPNYSQDYRSNFSTRKKWLIEIFFAVCFVLYVLFKQACSSNFYYTLYILFPALTGSLVYIRRNSIKLLFKKSLQYKIGKLIFVALVYGFDIGTFFNRKWLIPVIMGNVYIIYRKNNKSMLLIRVWFLILAFLICLVLYLPLVNTREYNVWYQLISCLAYYVSIALMNYYININGSVSCVKFLFSFPTNFQWIMIIIFLNNYMVNVVFETRPELLPFCHLVSWTLLVFCVLSPILSPPLITRRSLNCLSSLLALYLLMSGGIEPMFILLYTWFIIIWIILELKNVEQLKIIWKRSFNEGFINICADNNVENISLLLLGFFGILEMASFGCNMNPWTKAFMFDQDNCRLTAIFFGLKLVVPIFILMVLFHVLIKILNIRIGYFFNVLLLFFGIAMLQLFFAVNNQGSWREMGSSVARFGTSAVTFFALTFINYTSTILTTTYVNIGGIGNIERSVDF